MIAWTVLEPPLPEKSPSGLFPTLLFTGFTRPVPCSSYCFWFWLQSVTPSRASFSFFLLLLQRCFTRTLGRPPPLRPSFFFFFFWKEAPPFSVPLFPFLSTVPLAGCFLLQHFPANPVNSFFEPNSRISVPFLMYAGRPPSSVPHACVRSVTFLILVSGPGRPPSSRLCLCYCSSPRKYRPTRDLLSDNYFLFFAQALPPT